MTSMIIRCNFIIKLAKGNLIFLKNYGKLQNMTFTRLHSESNENDPEEPLGHVFDKMKNKNIPRVTRLSFKSRSSPSKHPNQRNFCGSDSRNKIINVPILEIRDHIFPFFEKLVKTNDQLLSIISSIPPKTKKIGLFARKEGTNPHECYSIGTLASYETWPHNPSDSPYVILRSFHRIKRLDDSPLQPKNLQYSDCEVMYDESVDVTSEIRILSYQIIDFVRRLQPFFPYNSASDELNKRVLNPVYWSYVASDFTMPSETTRLQGILEENDLIERLRKTAKILNEELQFFNISSQMTQKMKEVEIRESYLYNLTRLKQLVDNTISHYNQPYINRNGEAPTSPSSRPQTPNYFNTTPKTESTFEKKIKERMANLILPEAVKAAIEDELIRISQLDKSSVEYGIIQTYIDNLTLLPWGIYKGVETPLTFARDVLNEDHYGLEEVKDTILEHLAVSSRVDKAKGRILCFVGPPGVGKTSIVKSIARALNREYVRISVGGIDDSCEIKGHRRTYIGALPGKIVKGLQLAKSMDPVFCIDEIDKLCRTHRGDPSGPLLEAFDPEQNMNFTDHFLDLPCDLSRVIFVCTANTTSTINTPLLDRMEVIPISGYTSEEKMQIVKSYIIPSIVKLFNIESLYDSSIKIDPQVFQKLTDEYFLEAGVRKVKSCIEKMCRKSLKEIEMGEKETVHITLENVHDYAGYPQYPLRRFSPEDSTVGIVTGLSAIEGYSTGFTLDIECDLVESTKEKGQIVSTGLVGKSLDESGNVAFLMAKKVVTNLYPENKLLETMAVRLHFLEGGIKKDGPSAGVAIFSAIISQALSIPISRNLAMTGEITLKGKIISVGGIKEKVTAALRHGIPNVILPTENKPQFWQLSESIKSKVNITFVNNIEELLTVVFPILPSYNINNSTVINQQLLN